MSSLSRIRSALLWGALALPLLVGCNRFRHQLTPEKDAIALPSVFARFVSTKGEPPLLLTICEDLERAAQERADGCSVAHVARGGLRGQTDVIAHEAGGCDVCAERNLVFIVARLEGGELRDPVSLRGTAELGNSFRDNAYAMPYRVDLATQDDEVSLQLELRANGQHFLRLFDGPLDEARVSRFWVSDGGATCPLSGP
ncbi:MAG: hypothetical protein CSA65_08775 [Proteobacteria bacterium]|nr:MAG: hypothetical protein CSA65_08775 [Pseudomonadota bacterium]